MFDPLPRSRPLSRCALRATPVFAATLAFVALALPGCDEGDPFPLTVSALNQPAPALVRFFAHVFDNGRDECGNGETELDLYGAYPDFTANAIIGVDITRCTKPDGSDRIFAGTQINLTENFSVEGCLNPFVNTVDFSGAGRWIVTDASCFDGESFSSRVVAGEIQANGGVVWENVLIQGQQMDDGLEYVDPRFVFPIFSAGFDGEQPFFAMGIKVRAFGSMDDPQIAVGLCRRTPAGWVCVSEYRLGQGPLAAYQDLGGIRADIDCPPNSVLGGDDCPIPATPVLAALARDTFTGTFPPPDITALFEGDFQGSVPRFVVRKDDSIPGLTPRVYQSLGEDFEFGRGGGAFSAKDDLGASLVARWRYTETVETVVAVQGDPIDGTDDLVGQPFGIGYFDEFVAFGNFVESTGAEQIVYERGNGRLGSLYQTELGVVDNQTVTGNNLFVRGLSNRVLINDVALTNVSDRRIVAAPIRSIEILKDGASGLYGSDALAGVVNFISRENLEIESSHDFGVTGFEALTMLPDGDLLAGTGDEEGSLLFAIDGKRLQADVVANGPFGGVQGLANDGANTWLSSGPQLHLVELDKGATQFIANFLDQDDVPIDDVFGLAWDAESQKLVGVTGDNRIGDIDTTTGRIGWRLAVPPVGGQSRSLAVLSASDYVVGKESGDAFQLGLDRGTSGGGYAAGPPPLPTAIVQTLLDTGDNPLAGLTGASVPEPGAEALAVVSGLILAALRRARRR